MPDELITVMELRAPGYEATGQKVVKTTKAIAEAEEQAARVHRQFVGALHDSTLPGVGLDRIASDLQSRSRGMSANGLAAAHAAVARANGSAGGAVLQTGRLTVRSRKSAGAQVEEFFDEIAGSVQKGLQALGPLETAVKTVAAVVAVEAGIGLHLMKTAAEFDSLRQSLVAIEGSAAKANLALGDLKDLAKAPGLGFEEAVRGYSGLRNAGFGQAFSEETIKQFANANARGGGDAESFGRILLQLRQAAGREYLSQEDLTPIGEAGIPVNSLLKKLYGTGDTEELKSKGVTADRAIHDLVAELATLPRVAGGAKNGFDNLADAFRFAEVAAGDALNGAFLPFFDDVAEAASKLTENGEIAAAFEAAAENIRTIFDGQEDGLEGVLREMLVAVRDLSAGTRNLAENSRGFVDWVSDHVRHSLVGRALGWDKEGAGGGLDLVSEHDRNEMDAEADALVGKANKERADMKRAGFSGTLKQWRALNDDQRKAWLAAAKPKDDESRAKAEQTQERIARAVEKTAEYTRRQVEIQSFAAGGGELARMGVASTELNGHADSESEFGRQVARLFAKYSGFAVSRREASRQRNDGRGLY